MRRRPTSYRKLKACAGFMRIVGVSRWRLRHYKRPKGKHGRRITRREERHAKRQYLRAIRLRVRESYRNDPNPPAMGPLTPMERVALIAAHLMPPVICSTELPDEPEGI